MGEQISGFNDEKQMEKGIGALGDDGWELVSISLAYYKGTNPQMAVAMKRPRQ